VGEMDLLNNQAQENMEIVLVVIDMRSCRNIGEEDFSF
jgi:hypothetical protein